jgi:hypothetical protein
MESIFSVTSIAAAMLLAGLIIFIGITAAKQKGIKNWGRRIAILVLWGLAVCIFAALRDGYQLSVQAMADPSVTPGLFPIDSIQSTVCSILGGVVGLGSLSAAFIRRQGYRKAVFFALGAAVIIKALVIEISRVIL